MFCPRTQHRNNVPILRGEKQNVSLKILHQAGFETARQAVTLAKLRALAIAIPQLSPLENAEIGTALIRHDMNKRNREYQQT